MFSILRSCRPPQRANTTNTRGWLAALLDALEDAHVVRNRCSAHVEDAAETRVFHLKIPCTIGELHRAKCVHGHPGCPYWMALGLQSTRRIYRQLSVLLSSTFKNRVGALPLGGQAHGFVFDEFRNGEAVVCLHERQIAKFES